MDAKYYQLHKEEIRAKQKIYYEKNKKSFSARNKAWREDNKDEIKKYLTETIEKRKKVNRLWRIKNREKLATKQRLYRKNNPEKHKEYELNRDRSKEQKKRFNIYRKMWAKNNPDKIQSYYQKRRSALNEKNNTLSAEEIREQRKMQKGLCYYCGLVLDNKGRGHIDHKKPISKGGYNNKENIVIACSSCNLVKGAKTEKEFIKLQEGVKK